MIPEKKRIFLALASVAVVYLVIILIGRIQDRGFEVRGQASGIVESFDILADEQLRAYDTMFEHDQLGSAHCQIVVSSWIEHLIFDRQDECPLTVVNRVSGYDLLLAYYDSVCKYPPRLVVDLVNGQYRFIVDVENDRGGCDNIAVPKAIGIHLEYQLLADIDE
ncbi:MAG: hypothetical protein OXF00_09510 [bacterium]|nr:hypothetical protein [bacterium]